MVAITVGHGVKTTLVNSSDVEIGTAATPLAVSGTVTESAPASTTFATAQITVSGTEVLILPVDATRLGAALGNFSAIDIYLGPTGVTALNGYTLKPGASYNIDFPNYTGAIYGLAASGNPVIQRIVLT